MLIEKFYQGNNLVLSGINPENDAIREAAWTYDLDLVEFYRPIAAPRPLSTAEVRQFYEGRVKKVNEGSLFIFALKTIDDGTLVGMAEIEVPLWNHADGRLKLFIVDSQRTDLFCEAGELVLNYCFNELNLFRVSIRIPAYKDLACQCVEQLGFRHEVCQREACFRGGRFWDIHFWGILAEEWTLCRKK